MRLPRGGDSKLLAIGSAREPKGVFALPPVTDLYRRFFPPLYRRALWLLGDREEALDVAQDAFVEFVQRRGLLGGERQAFALMYQVATFQSLTRLRKRARREDALERSGLQVTNQAPTSEGDLRQLEAAMELAQLTQGESPQAMTAALLHFVEGCSILEVGEALNVSRKTVSRLLERFIDRARKRGVRLGRERQ